MKIGILTHQYINNYGAFLQAWALRKAISELFPEDEVQIIDYVNVKHYIINAGGWFRFYKNRETLKEWFAKIHLPNTFAKARNQEMVLSKRCFNARQINELAFDCIVVGSDEVWNYRDTKGNAELKFGVGLTCKNLIAYPRHWRKNIIHILHFRFGIDTPATYIKKIQQLQTFTKYEHTIPRTHSVKSAEDIATLKLDLIVLGSDEIWNLCGSGYHPLKFGTGLEEQQTIAYAPSVGAVTEDTEVPAEIASGLKNIDRISGRDTETVKFIERVSERNAEKMLDPTFLYNFDADIKKDNIQPKPYKYILIYDCKLTLSMVDELKQYAQNNSLKIIGAGDYKTYYDEGFINLSPYEWVDLFRNAEKIITGTFHGTVFSIKYEKPVVCYPTEKNRINKIRSLLEDMKIPSRLLEIGREKELIDMLNKPMNYMQTQEYIARKVQEADEFLVGEKR